MKSIGKVLIASVALLGFIGSGFAAWDVTVNYTGVWQETDVVPEVTGNVEFSVDALDVVKKVSNQKLTFDIESATIDSYSYIVKHTSLAKYTEQDVDLKASVLISSDLSDYLSYKATDVVLAENWLANPTSGYEYAFEFAWKWNENEQTPKTPQQHANEDTTLVDLDAKGAWLSALAQAIEDARFTFKFEVVESTHAVIQQKTLDHVAVSNVQVNGVDNTALPVSVEKGQSLSFDLTATSHCSFANNLENVTVKHGNDTLALTNNNGTVSVSIADVQNKVVIDATAVQPASVVGTLSASTIFHSQQTGNTATLTVKDENDVPFSEFTLVDKTVTAGNAEFDQIVTYENGVFTSAGESGTVSFKVHVDEFDLTSEAITLQARQPLQTFVVSFYDGTSTNPFETVNVTENLEGTQTVGSNMPANPERTGYEFTGWLYYDNNIPASFSSDVVVTKDLDVVATWTKQNYNITINLDDENSEVGASIQGIEINDQAVQSMPATIAFESKLEFAIVPDTNHEFPDLADVTITNNGNAADQVELSGGNVIVTIDSVAGPVSISATPAIKSGQQQTTYYDVTFNNLNHASPNSGAQTSVEDGKALNAITLTPDEHYEFKGADDITVTMGGVEFNSPDVVVSYDETSHLISVSIPEVIDDVNISGNPHFLGTAENPLDADELTALLTGTDDNFAFVGEAYGAGVVVSNNAYSNEFHNFYFAKTSTSTNKIEAFKPNYGTIQLSNAQKEASGLIGYEVAVHGTLKNYKGTGNNATNIFEFDQGVTVTAVNAPAIVSISVPATLNVTEGQTAQITVTANPSIANLPADLSFTSSNTNVVTVDQDGTVHGVQGQAGNSATITVSGTGVTSVSCEVSVITASTIQYEDKTASWSISTANDLGSNETAQGITGNISTGSFQWTYTRTLVSGDAYTGSITNGYLQIGKNGGVDNIEFSTSNISGKIKSVTINCASYQGKHNVAITVGGDVYLESTATPAWSSNSGGERTGTGTSTGEIVISITGGTRALYIKSISVVYETIKS